MDEMNLNLTVESESGRQRLAFRLRRLVCACWVGRDEKALQAHMDELAHLGVSGPTRTPIYINFSRYLVTSFSTVEVITAETSGEVEYVAFIDDKEIYVGVGSDHTDRGFEKHGIDASKQMYAKVVAPVVCPYREVKDHWDQIILRSWTAEDDERALYQEDPLSSILELDTLLEKFPRDDGLPADGIVLFSGTVEITFVLDCITGIGSVQIASQSWPVWSRPRRRSRSQSLKEVPSVPSLRKIFAPLMARPIIPRHAG